MVRLNLLRGPAMTFTLAAARCALQSHPVHLQHGALLRDPDGAWRLAAYSGDGVFSVPLIGDVDGADSVGEIGVPVEELRFCLQDADAGQPTCEILIEDGLLSERSSMNVYRVHSAFQPPPRRDSAMVPVARLTATALKDTLTRAIEDLPAFRVAAPISQHLMFDFKDPDRPYVDEHPLACQEARRLDGDLALAAPLARAFIAALPDTDLVDIDVAQDEASWMLSASTGLRLWIREELL